MKNVIMKKTSILTKINEKVMIIMRKIKKNPKIKLTDLVCSNFIFKGKNIQFYYEIKIETINKINSGEINIDLENYKESFVKIVWEQIFKKESITYQELIAMDSEMLFTILNVFVIRNRIIKENYEKQINIINPFVKFLTVMKESITEMDEEKKKTKEKVNASNEMLMKSFMKISDTLNETSIEVLKQIYRTKGISEDKMDLSPEKRKIALDYYLELMNSGEKLKNDCKKAFEKYNWFVNIDFDKEEQKKIIEIQDNEEEVNDYIISITTEDLMNKMLDLWKETDVLCRRIHIIEKCFEAYIKEEYWLLVPTMLAQVEGVIIDIFDVKGKYQMKILEKKIKELVDITREEFDSNAKCFYVDTLLSGFEVGKECNSLSRHSILHGYNTEYGNKVNALKIIYFFDYVVRALYYASQP